MTEQQLHLGLGIMYAPPLIWEADVLEPKHLHANAALRSYLCLGCEWVQREYPSCRQ